MGEVGPEEVRELLKIHPTLSVTENNRVYATVKCSLTDHEMPCRKSAVLQHVNGKRYKRLSKNILETFDFEKFAPHLVPSIKKKHEHQLFCTLTLRHVNKIPAHVLRHVNGRRYLKAKVRWETCQQTGEKFIPTSQLNRQNLKDVEMYEDLENGNESDDSFSDLYPEKYFERLTLSSDDNEKEETPKSIKTSKKKKKVKGKSLPNSESKRKSTTKEHPILSKKPKVQNPKTRKPNKLQQLKILNGE